MITVLCWQIHQLIENVRTQMLIFCKRNSHGKTWQTQHVQELRKTVILT